MNFQRRAAATAAALSTAAFLGGGVAYAATQMGNVADGLSAAPNTGSLSTGAMMPSAGMRGQDTSMGMGRFTEEQPFDAQFLDQMAVHHRGAIMSTQAMIAGSTRPELRALAEEILTGQREQLSQMRAWRAQWYPDLDPTFGMGGSMMRGSGSESMADGMMGGSTMGGSTGTERMYLQMMIVHHQLAVDMAEQAQQEAAHPELKDLAAVIAGEQAAQITQMRGYLAASPSPAGD